MFVEIERIRRPLRLLAGAAALVLGATACDEDGVSGPIDGGAPAFSRQITLPELEEALTAGPVRVEVKLLPGGTTAREVELELPEKLMDQEEIEDRISSISVAGGGGELTLQSTGLTVEFNSSARLEGEDGDLTLAEFAERVEAALAAGRLPAVEAKRAAPAEPQAPDDPTFVANRLELDDEAEEPKIELNLDRDNLELSGGGAGEPDAWIRVLGLRIELRVSEGITELEQENDQDDPAGTVEFEDRVTAVDVPGATFTLANGTVVEMNGTTIDPEGDLLSLEAVADAVTGGQNVRAEGQANVVSTDPRVLSAVVVKFEVDTTG